MTKSPLTPEEVSQQLLALGVPADAPVAVAVSGGADSLALAILTHTCRSITALTVDHGLRDNAAEEAQHVHRQLTARGIRHHILTWQHTERPDSNIQAMAREARYELMQEWCTKAGVQYLLTAHHMDDQAETVLLRLARGSGIYGLAAMDAVRPLSAAVTLVRPVLDVPKQRLVDALLSHGIDWIEDPSNRQGVFERVKARRMLSDPPLDGLTAPRLAETAQRLKRTREAIRFYEQQWLKDAVEFHESGYAILRRGALLSAPEEIILRGLTSILRFAGGGQYGPRFEKLERLYDALRSENFNGQTLAGVKFSVHGKTDIIAVREIAAAQSPLRISNDCFWDSRFDIGLPNNAEDDGSVLFLGMVGQPELSAFRREVLQLVVEGEHRNIHKAVLDVFPAFFTKERLIAVPHIGYKASDVCVPFLTHRWLSLSNNEAGMSRKSDKRIQ